jgi:hypothetical protein
MKWVIINFLFENQMKLHILVYLLAILITISSKLSTKLTFLA